MDRHGIEDPTEDTDYWLDGNDGWVNFDVNTRPEERVQNTSPVAIPPHAG